MENTKITWVRVEDELPQSSEDVHYITIFLKNHITGDESYKVETGQFYSTTIDDEYGFWIASDGYEYEHFIGSDEHLSRSTSETHVVAWSREIVPKLDIEPFKP